MDVTALINDLESRGIALWVNGDRLNYRSPKGSLREEDLAALRSNKEKVLAWLREREAVPHDEQARFAPFPMTDIQRAYATGQNEGYDLGGTGCHSYAEIRTERLDRSRLEQAWHELIQRHDMLSAVVVPPDSLQVVKSRSLPVLQAVDLAGHNPDVPDAEYLRHRAKLENRSYPLGTWPLHEFQLLQFDECSILQFSVDMIIADFVSVRVMVEELLTLYAGNVLPELEDTTFRDIITSRNHHSQSAAGFAARTNAKKYWSEIIPSLSGKPLLPTLTSADRTSEMPVRFTRRTWRCSPAAWSKLTDAASTHGVTPSATLLTAYADVLRRWSSTSDFCVNVTSMNRDSAIAGINRIIGDFTEMTLHACHPHTGTFSERVHATQEQLSEELSHAAYSGVDVLRDIARTTGQPAVIPVVFTSALGADTPHNNGPAYNLVSGVSRTPQVWIDCQAFQDGGSCNVNWDVREDVFEPALIDDMWESFTDLLDRLVDDGSAWQETDSVHLPDKTIAIRNRIHKTHVQQTTRCLHDGFWDNVQQHPHQPALVCGGKTYSYQHLAGYVGALQHELSDVGPGDYIAIVLGNGVWQIAAAVAVVSTGAAYVPIDHEQPAIRQRSMIEACRPANVITNSHFSEENTDISNINVDTLSPIQYSCTIASPVSPTETAYIIFTSGSTGIPKGVVVTHSAAMSTIDSVNNLLGRNKRRTVLGVSKLSFDLSVYDIFGTFASGGTLVLPLDEESRNPSKWIDFLVDNNVDTWNSVPALFQMLVREVEVTRHPNILSLDLVMLSGDRIPGTLPAHAAPHFPNAELISLGGATEGGIWSIFHPMTCHTNETSIPYGTALPNQGMWVLDEACNECPDWVRGQIHISGESLATGYLNDPTSTAEKFFFSEKHGTRMYATGDIGSYRPDGVIEFHGRRDNQLKINGYRVETGEIEGVLESNDFVERAIVLAQETSDPIKLHAFVTDAQSDKDELKDAGQIRNSELRTMLEQRWTPADTSPDTGIFATWMRLGNEAAMAALLAAFQQAGVFLVAGKYHTLTEITAAIHPSEEYRELITRWLNILTGEGLATKDDEGWTVSQQTLDFFVFGEAWDQFGNMEAEINNSKELFNYQRHAAEALLSQLRGEISPTEVFFPEGDTHNARTIYGENRISKAMNAAAAEAVIGIAEHHADHPVRILEVGAGIGATTEKIVSRLPENVIEYRFTDISTFFLHKAQKMFAHCGAMTYGLFDMNSDCTSQDVEFGGYDIILCANVLHNSVNIEESFTRLKQLRRPGGVIVIVEPITELYAALISVSIKMNLVDFTDHRAESHKVFIEDAQWDQVFRDTQMHRIAEYPNTSDPLRECGQRLIIVGADDDDVPTLNSEDILGYLRAHLPGYMVPASVNVLPELPLTSNGKVDRKALAQLCLEPVGSPNNRIDPPRNETEEQIATIWRDVLDTTEVGRNDDFYALGGDSLLMAETVTRLRQEIPGLQQHTWDALMRGVLKVPTIAGISALAQAAGSSCQPEALKAVNSANHTSPELTALSTVASGSPTGSSNLHVYRLPKDATFCRVMIHAGTGRLKDYEFLMPELLQRQPEIAHVGFTAGDADRFLDYTTRTLIRDLAQSYAQELDELDMESYQLVGYCIGGMLALETAKALTELGRDVRQVTCISTHQCPHRVTNELLCELAYGCIFNANLSAMGANFDLKTLAAALEHTLDGINRNISDEELCTLEGPYADIGEFFQKMAVLSPRARRKLIYRSIREFDTDSESTRGMLDILYDVFRHSLLGTIDYVPDVYFGDVVVLQPTEGVTGFYPSLGGDIDWPATVLGNLQIHAVAGSHATCLLQENVPSLLPFFTEREQRNG
ncbi:non-ribosomal peptide synthetase [Corynebacterium diphtheriae]|nr:non-ribosomal peptide synthetase [Corynebacterium diphtheriae]